MKKWGTSEKTILGESCVICGLPRWFNGTILPVNAGEMGLIPGLGRSLAVGNGNPLQYSCLENYMDREA